MHAKQTFDFCILKKSKEGYSHCNMHQKSKIREYKLKILCFKF